MEWQLRDAKNRFSEVIQRARKEAPQVIILRGERAAVAVSAKTYSELMEKRASLVEHLLTGPPWSDDLVEVINARSRVPGRAVTL
ncbi:MAG: type II toxin-antitoxin system Phd/YefM family antitoxin [Methylocapsa sp.]|nr:type II toxin-antitoxin system Phd/YefM family antitoxin [Methylocapsa sp.]